MFVLPCIATCFFIIKIKVPLNFPKFIFVKKLYMFQAVPLPIIRNFPLYIRHWYMSCRFEDSFQARSGWKTPDDGQRNCQKHVEFLDKNKFGEI
jgi:hypothetical protein